MKIPVGIEKVLYLAATDPAFREALFADRTEALGRPGVGLSPDDAAILKCIPDDRLNLMIGQIDPSAHGRRFMQKVAACAVALAATTAGAASADRRSGDFLVAGTQKPEASAALDGGTYSNTDGGFVEIEKEPRTRRMCFGSLKKDPATKSESAAVEAYVMRDPHGIERPVAVDAIDSLKNKLATVLENALPRDKKFFGHFLVQIDLDRHGKPATIEFGPDSDKNETARKCILDFFQQQIFPSPSSEKGMIRLSLQVLVPIRSFTIESKPDHISE